jgi:hypothetical protein
MGHRSKYDGHPDDTVGAKLKPDEAYPCLIRVGKARNVRRRASSGHEFQQLYPQKFTNLAHHTIHIIDVNLPLLQESL